MNPKLKALTIGIGIMLTISGCIEEPQQKKNNPPSSTPFFPVQKYPSEFSMTALLEGELVLEDNCLRVDDYDNNYLLVWPYGYSFSNGSGDVILIIDETGHQVLRVGDKIKLGGGEISDKRIAQYSSELPSDRCSVPYWIVGEILTND